MNMKAKLVEIDIGNGIFPIIGREFDRKYQYIAEKTYKIEIQYLDFENHTLPAIRTINDWIRRKTRGKISGIVSQMSADTMLVIANTLYLKAAWEVPFLTIRTKLRPFFPNGPNRPSINVPMMVHGGCFPYYYWKEMQTKVLGIPYKQRSTMYVFLPDDSNRAKVRELLGQLNADTLNNIIGNMKVEKASIQFPKMHIQNSFNLKQVFGQLGASSFFDRERSDLYRMLSSGSSGDDLDVDDALDFLEDTQNNAELELKNAFGCLITEIDAESTECLSRVDCRYGGGVCLCCVFRVNGRYRRQIRRWDNKKHPLYLNELMHKVDVVVNEKGTESGAVTSTQMLGRIIPLVNFHANGPFLMLIREEATQLPLFYGSVFDPTTS
nr:serine protease inhibitor 28Dc-like [Aedes albopictus]